MGLRFDEKLAIENLFTRNYYEMLKVIQTAILAGAHDSNLVDSIMKDIESEVESEVADL